MHESFTPRRWQGGGGRKKGAKRGIAASKQSLFDSKTQELSPLLPLKFDTKHFEDCQRLWFILKHENLAILTIDMFFNLGKLARVKSFRWIWS